MLIYKNFKFQWGTFKLCTRLLKLLLLLLSWKKIKYNQLAYRLPNNHSFVDIRRTGKIYVNKTELLFELTRSNQPIFLSRPRRFGKSTLVSTLKELFCHGIKPYDGNDSYFKCLAIKKLWQEDAAYTVMHFDFAKHCQWRRCASV